MVEYAVYGSKAYTKWIYIYIWYGMVWYAYDEGGIVYMVTL